MGLTTEQYLLLNNLMYMDSDHYPLTSATEYTGETIGYWIDNISVSNLDDNTDYGSYMTGRDWKNLIAAIKQDPVLCNMRIETTHIDFAEGGGGGYSALFRSESSGDAVVAFRGTASGEWKDNFTGGNATDTAQQENALEWYQQIYREYNLENYEVSVTGHSKGGNKSKYITIRDDTVDKCVSFDGQGFSDKFIEHYREEIAQRQYKIHNNNVDEDYVNLLLNDIGETTYYNAEEIGRGGFLENHCPNTFLRFQDDGSFTMSVNPDGQDPKMQTLDEFFNGYLRSLSEEDRNDTLEMVNAFLDGAFQFNNKTIQEGIDQFREVAVNPQYSDDLARIVAYTIKYGQDNPEMYGDIKEVLREIGLEDYCQYADVVETVLNFRIDVGFIHLDFDDVCGLVIGATEFTGAVIDVANLINPFGTLDSNAVLDELCKLIKDKTGYEMSPQELRELFDLVKQINNELKTIEINYNGSDIKVESVQTRSESGGNHRFSCDVTALKREDGDLKSYARTLRSIADAVEKEAGNLGFSLKGARGIYRNLIGEKEKLFTCSNHIEAIARSLCEIAEQYENTERKCSEAAHI